jgi:hypothetical protein
MPESGSWLLLEELLERGDPAFVHELRRIHDADRLGDFAKRWYGDPRPWVRQYLLDYLDLPLSAYRHEALVKRLFKLAEQAGDDAVMARFVVAFDRSVRRVKSNRPRYLREVFTTRQAAVDWMRQLNEAGAETVHLQELEGRYSVMANWRGGTWRWENRFADDREVAERWSAGWRQEGAAYTNIHDHGGKYIVTALLRRDRLRSPARTTMPRDHRIFRWDPQTGKLSLVADREFRKARKREQIDPAVDKQLKYFADLGSLTGWTSWPEDLDTLPKPARRLFERFRLFTLHTRHYLRRRAWRFFRRLGKQQPERYVPALRQAFKLYTDADAVDGLALLDNWGLVHALFHHCPALIAKTSGWTPAPGHALAELTPAPLYEPLWLEAPQALVDLLQHAQCRPVRQWAIHLIRRDPAALLRHLPFDDLLNLLGHSDEEVVALAGEALERAPGLDLVPLPRWLALLETPNTTALDLICQLMAKHVRPEQISFAEVVQLAASRPVPVAQLGVRWLQMKKPQNEEECRALLGLAEAQAEPVRPEIVHWARRLLSDVPYFRSEWVLDFLDSRHEDVRTEGWQWLQEEPRARDEVELWRRLLESPYDDVRLKLVVDLEQRIAKTGQALTERVALNPVLVRFLWAAVLLNIHRGNRHKPAVIRQLVRRLEQRPEEASELLPILSVALRSLRGPEWRAGLAGVVQAVSQRPELAADVRTLFPELRM